MTACLLAKHLAVGNFRKNLNNPMKKHFHIIWWTFKTWPVWDERGNWQWLADFYKDLAEQKIETTILKPIANRFKNQDENVIIFNDEQKELLADELLKLINNDNIAQGLDVQEFAIKDNYVEMLVFATEEEMMQKVARLKSRLATLLSFKFKEVFKGENTWGNGIWKAEINSEKGIELISEHIKTKKNLLPISQKKVFKNAF